MTKTASDARFVADGMFATEIGRELQCDQAGARLKPAGVVSRAPDR